jgi:hypothetical protein
VGLVGGGSGLCVISVNMRLDRGESVGTVCLGYYLGAGRESSWAVV